MLYRCVIPTCSSITMYLVHVYSKYYPQYILYQVYRTRYLVQKTSLRFVQPMAWWPVLIRILTGEGGVFLFSRLTCRDSGPLPCTFSNRTLGTSTPKGGFCEVPYCCHNAFAAGNHGAVVYTNRSILPVILVVLVVVAGFSETTDPSFDFSRVPGIVCRF